MEQQKIQACFPSQLGPCPSFINVLSVDWYQVLKKTLLIIRKVSMKISEEHFSLQDGKVQAEYN